MTSTLNHTQRLNLHALLGAQRADVGSICAIWAVQDKLVLDADEETTIELKREFAGGQERVLWNSSLSIPAMTFDFAEAATHRVRAAVEAWSDMQSPRTSGGWSHCFTRSPRRRSGRVRVRAGLAPRGFRRPIMYLPALASRASIPSLRSSPWMRGALQNAYSGEADHDSGMMPIAIRTLAVLAGIGIANRVPCCRFFIDSRIFDRRTIDDR